MKFLSYEDYIEKSRFDKNIDSYNSLTSFEIDINGVNSKIEKPKNYDSLINDISDKVRSELLSSNCELTKGNHALKIFDMLECDAVIELGNHFANQLSKKIYNTEVVVDIVHTYKSLNRQTPIKKSSWLWHYDNASPGQLKIMVYLNDVNKNNGSFEILSKGEECYLFKSSKISPEKSKHVVTRITDDKISNLEKQGYKIKQIEGKSGTFILFNQNILHRASVPTTSPEREVIIFNFRPYYKPVKHRVDKNFTFGWKNQVTKFVKSYPYKIDYIEQ